MNGRGITVGAALTATLRQLTVVTLLVDAKGVVLGSFEPACLSDATESPARTNVDEPEPGSAQGSWRDRGSLL